MQGYRNGKEMMKKVFIVPDFRRKIHPQYKKKRKKQPISIGKLGIIVSEKKSNLTSAFQQWGQVFSDKKKLSELD